MFSKFLFADTILQYHAEKKTGRLDLTVLKGCNHFIKIHFKDGNIDRLSRGPNHGEQAENLPGCCEIGNTLTERHGPVRKRKTIISRILR